ncbi:hypothetical protein J4G37_20420 [Microvirga sp. 3-52]|nr:hypothetical protein [Microvirga sp. 3-52]
MEGGVKGCASSGVVHHPVVPCLVMAGLDPAIPMLRGAVPFSIGITCVAGGARFVP